VGGTQQGKRERVAGLPLKFCLGFKACKAPGSRLENIEGTNHLRTLCLYNQIALPCASLRSIVPSVQLDERAW